MSSEIFILRIILSFLVCGAYVTSMSRLSERLGSKLGGLLIGLPSTALMGLLFIAWVQGSAAALEASSVMPATISASMMFLVAFSLLFRYGLVLAYFGAVAVWFALNLPLVGLKVHDIFISLMVAAVLSIISISFFHHQPHRKLTSVKGGRLTLLIRATFAGGFVALAVACSKLFGPLWGGMFASFPAVFSAVVLIFGRAHGEEFTASMSKTMVQGALVNIIFVTCAHLFLGSYGAIVSILLGYATCLIFAIFSYRYIIPKI